MSYKMELITPAHIQAYFTLWATFVALTEYVCMVDEVASCISVWLDMFTYCDFRSKQPVVATDASKYKHKNTSRKQHEYNILW